MISKEILIAYINTLNDRECKSIYLMLKEMEGNKNKYVFYNQDAVEDESGLIKLTPRQYHNLLRLWGEEKTKGCFRILSKYLEGGKKVRAAHYQLLNGWVETQYSQQNRPVGRPKRRAIEVKFDEIQSKAQARLYVSQVPRELLEYNTNVEYLVNRWGEDILP